MVECGGFENRYREFFYREFESHSLRQILCGIWLRPLCEAECSIVPCPRSLMDRIRASEAFDAGSIPAEDATDLALCLPFGIILP